MFEVEVDEPERDVFGKIVEKNFKKKFDVSSAKAALVVALEDPEFPDDPEHVKITLVLKGAPRLSRSSDPL